MFLALAALVAVVAVVAVVMMVRGGGKSPDKKGPTESGGTQGSSSPSLTIPSELPSELPSSLPSDLRSILPSDLQSLLPTLANGAVP
ncbi:hypothetical protein OG585_06395 [Streptomyces sp. NBC_01340]|uniref:hypothetical protein n=1 Tax=Streptomyces sp. NBC_01340 TaxID=2903830 RepID=UPI002E0DC06F|nr:hypothetical protein OG585_06395 [Streptomyces sp. NBC_01340]